MGIPQNCQIRKAPNTWKKKLPRVGKKSYRESTGTYTVTEAHTVQEYDEENFCCKLQYPLERGVARQLLLTEIEEGVARRRGVLITLGASQGHI